MMITNRYMKMVNKNMNRSGAALLAVLFVITLVAVMSLGFLTRSDVELSCGENMILQSQMNYLAESGLEHARGLILNPQYAIGEYWTGREQEQIVGGSNDYYDVNVVKLGHCNYQIDCEAYREEEGEKIGRCRLRAELRLDPSLAMWVGDAYSSESETVVYGDIYCGGDLWGVAYIFGDAFADSLINNPNIQGKSNQWVDESEAPAGYPNIGISDFYPVYYVGTHSYPAGVISVEEINDITLGPTAANPKGIYYRGGHLKLGGNVTVNGTLVVKDDLKSIRGINSIKSLKNFPAAVVGHRLKMEYDGKLSIEGLALIKDEVEFLNVVNTHLMVTGCLFIIDHNVDGMVAGISSLTVIGSADKAAIAIWRSDASVWNWSPAESAFYKSITKL